MRRRFSYAKWVKTSVKMCRLKKQPKIQRKNEYKRAAATTADAVLIDGVFYFSTYCYECVCNGYQVPPSHTAKIAINLCLRFNSSHRAAARVKQNKKAVYRIIGSSRTKNGTSHQKICMSFSFGAVLFSSHCFDDLGRRFQKEKKSN